MNRPTIELGTKAETLERLEPVLRGARVLPQVRFTVREWRADPDRVLAGLRARDWSHVPLVLRSSARCEDAPGSSQAGRFRTVVGCVGAEVRTAVEEVVRSLCEGRDPDEDPERDQVFAQPQLRDARSSGVALSRDPSNGSHYVVVSYDETTGTTDSITSGRAEERRTYYWHRASPEPPARELEGVVALVLELVELTGTDALDVEFAVASDGALHLLQVRPLHTPPGDDHPLGAHLRVEADALTRVRERLRALGTPRPALDGTRAVYGTMPDWNPAEVLGARPRPLALSLYRELVTDGIWAYQRSNYGYRNLRSFPLLVSLGGLPYVDVRVSFNSFVPADLDADLGRRLVDEYTERLLASPLDHDKVEFAIVYSCYTLDLRERLARLGERDFSEDDRERIAASLLALTNRISAEPVGLFRADVEKIAELERRQASLAEESDHLDPVSRVYWLLEDCKRYGTLPFAGIARAAFVAVQLLDSLVAVGILAAEERQAFLRSLHTVRAQMDEDLARLPRAEFLARYGHLRPGTYEVTSTRYDADPSVYFDRTSAPPAPPFRPAFELDASRLRRLDRELEEHGLDHDAGSLLRFLRDAVEGREYAKFTFTRSLSDALEVLARLAACHGLSREDLSYADVEVVRRLHGGTEDAGAVLEASAAAGRERYSVTRRLTLPPLLTGPDDVFAFHLPASEPNYVTTERAQGPVVDATSADGARPDLRGGIAMIPSADPGHDWIFSHGVAGFITMYGGYNSHMAIRAGELGIPAVIGAGEPLFRTWAAASRLSVDCLNRRVEVLR